MRAPFRFRAARAVLRLGVALILPVDVAGLDGLPDGAYVLTCNHLSWVDPFLLIAALPASPRLHFLGRRAAIYNRTWKRWVLEFMGGVIPVESGDLAHLRPAVHTALREGGAVGIFPEGRTGTVEGVLQPLRRGVAHFAHDAGVPVVPAALSGTLELWRGKHIRLVLGPPLTLGGEITADMTAIEEAMGAVLPSYQELPGPHPWPWLTTLLR